MDNNFKKQLVILICGFFKIIFDNFIEITKYYYEIFLKQNQRISNKLLQNLILTTPENEHLNIGLILAFNRKTRCIWMKKRSTHWWDVIVQMRFKDDDNIFMVV